jgi:hypothetical protein
MSENKGVVFAISGEAQAKLEKLSTDYKAEFGYVMSLFTHYMAETQNEKKAYLNTLGDLQNEANKTSFYTYVLDDNGIIDIFELMRGKVNRLLEDPETFDKTVADGMASPDGVVLDYRKTVFGKPNANLGMPLDGTSYQRSIIAIVADNENFTGATLAEISGNDKAAKALPPVEPFKTYKAFINQNKKNPQRYSLYEGSKFQPIATVVTNAEIANKITATEFDALEEIYRKEFAAKKNSRVLVPVRGYVTWLGMEVINGRRSFILTDPDTEEGISCKMQEKMPVAFQRADEIIAFVKLWASKQNKIGCDVKAYMVI